MRIKITGSLLLLALVGAGILYIRSDRQSPVASPAISGKNQPAVNSVFALPTASDEGDSEPRSGTIAQVSNFDEIEVVKRAEQESFYKRFDLIEIGRQTIDDGDFNALVAYLRDDSALLAQFLAEYRANTDPARAKRLAHVLDELDDIAITTLAEELVFSGDIESQKAGLNLLAGQQSKNPAARIIITQVLEMEKNPKIISSALNALAQPSKTSAQEKERLLGYFFTNAKNDDALVRRQSLALMRRWGENDNLNSYYIDGLQDPDLGVRTTAVLSLKSSKQLDDSVYDALAKVIENNHEDGQLRRNALLVLEKLGLDEEKKQRFLDILSAS